MIADEKRLSAVTFRYPHGGDLTAAVRYGQIGAASLPIRNSLFVTTLNLVMCSLFKALGGRVTPQVSWIILER
jgi:hypothetical protein